MLQEVRLKRELEVAKAAGGTHATGNGNGAAAHARKGRSESPVRGGQKAQAHYAAPIGDGRTPRRARIKARSRRSVMTLHRPAPTPGQGAQQNRALH